MLVGWFDISNAAITAQLEYLGNLTNVDLNVAHYSIDFFFCNYILN